MAGGVLSEDFPGLAGFRAGSLLAGYRLETQVGAGGMAAVFRARDQRLGRLVALKILAPGLTADEAFRRRFIAESRAAAMVDDPHIIPVYEAGETGGVLFIAMRFVTGGDLRRVLEREGTLTPVRAAEFLSPVASALDAAHGAGLVHRDVKPANILVDAHPGRPDHVYLSDFGVSKGAGSSVSLTGVGQFLGTPDYSAPEQIEGRAVGGRTDQYALACVAYQLLTGTVPFERDQGMAVLLAHLSAPPPSLAARRPDLPAAADRVLARGMAKLPEKRYASCQDFAEALRESLGLAPYHPRIPVSGNPRSPSPAPGHPQTQAVPPSTGLPGPAAAPPDADEASTVTKAPPWSASSAAGPGEAGLAAPAGDRGHPPAHRPRRVGRVIGHRPAGIAVAASIAVAGLVIAIGVIPGTHGTHSTGGTHGMPAAHSAPGQVRWTTTAGYIALAAAGGTAYVGRNNGTAYALNAATGQVRWTYKTTGNHVSVPTVTVAGSTAYIGSADNKVYALDTATGKAGWTYTTQGSVDWSDQPVAVAGNTIYVSDSDDNQVYALDAATGQVRWIHSDGQDTLSSPAVAGGTVYVSSADSKLYALDAATGHVRWIYNIGGAVFNAGPVAVAGGTVYVGTQDGSVDALDSATGKVRWTRATGSAVGSRPTVAGGTVYLDSTDNTDKVYALDAATGKARWTYTGRGSLDGSPVVAGSTVYVGSVFEIYALNAATGKARWTYTGASAFNGSPVVAGSTVYVGSGYKVYALSDGGSLSGAASMRPALAASAPPSGPKVHASVTE
jgi:eukaryotic-like serine/threonine-protein kinase